MKIKDGLQNEFDELIEMNSSDPYDKGIADYLVQWAELMETAIESGEKIENVWNTLSYKTDIHGIAGFMRSIAVRTLARFWVYGDALRILHNAEEGINEETAQGGTVNTASIAIPD